MPPGKRAPPARPHHGTARPAATRPQRERAGVGELPPQRGRAGVGAGHTQHADDP